MLEEIAKDVLNRTPATNQPMFDTTIDYDALVAKRNSAVAAWSALPKSEQATYTDQADFLEKQNAPDLKDPTLGAARNTALLLKEVRARLDREDPVSLLGIEPLDFEESTLELAESLENVAEIQGLYRRRKAATGTSKNAGITAEEAKKIKNCFSQARELFLAGRNGSLMVKPLNFFYSLTAYSYGIIILNNPLRYRKDMIPGSHGMTYLPTTVQAQFGGDAPRGAFSDLVGAFPTQLVKYNSVTFQIDSSQSIIDYYSLRHDISLGTLLSMVPEMSDYYKITTGRNSRCFPLEIASANDPRSLVWEFQIGNGETRPNSEHLENSFPGFPRSERHGKAIVSVSASMASTIKATIYTDIRGKLWFIENPIHPIILPEVAVHFLITSIFSNIMRYRPDEWGNVLLNEVSSDISLLTRHYFSSFERKLLPLILRSISRYYPIAL